MTLLNKKERLNGFTGDFVSNQIDNITGQVFTLLDAILSGEQNKATKDIIRRMSSEAHSVVYKLSNKKSVASEDVFEYWGVFKLSEEQKEDIKNDKFLLSDN